MNEKLALELAACTYFIASYNGLHKTKFQIQKHQDRPDFLLKDVDTGEMVGVEVMHLYYDAVEAKMVLGRLSGKLHGVMTISHLIQQLNSDLADKINTAASYDFPGKLILLVRVASPIFDRQDFDMYEDEITVPQPNTIAEIWLLFWDQTTGTYSNLKQIQ